MLTKADWRARARTARRRLTVDAETHRTGLAEFLTSPDRPEGWVVVYEAMGDELDLAPLVARDELGPFALTRTPAPDEGRDLTVHPFDSDREQHPYGFSQPVAGAPAVTDADIGVVLVPGLAFDRLGARLGRGQGYYDRLLARLGPRAARIGITGGYIVAELPAEPHDIPMTHLAGAFGVAPVPLDEPVG